MDEGLEEPDSFSTELCREDNTDRRFSQWDCVYVCQTTYLPDGECAAVEQRYFVSSIPKGILSRDEELALEVEGRCFRFLTLFRQASTLLHKLVLSIQCITKR